MTTDSDARWLDRLRYMENETHTFRLVDDWENLDLLERRWSVALVDQSPGRSRAGSIERLKDRCEFIVVHDSQAAGYYGFEPLLSSFAYRADLFEPGIKVRTTVVSNSRPIPIDVPDLLANHVSMGVEIPDATWAVGKGWSVGVDVKLPPLPAHFYITGKVEVRGEVAVHAMFRTPRDRDYFWTGIRPTPARQPAEALVISEAMGEKGRPRWHKVNRLQIRARARSAEGEVRVGGLDILRAVSRTDGRT